VADDFNLDQTRIHGNDGGADRVVLVDAQGRIIVVGPGSASLATEATLQALKAVLDAAWTPIHGSQAALVEAVPDVVTTHTNATGSAERLRRVVVSSDRACLFQVYVDAAVIASARTTIDSPTTTVDLGNGTNVPDGSIVRVDATNLSDQGTSQAEATMMVSA